MPAVFFALTVAVKRQWAAYWSNRPTEEPMDLLTVLESSERATSYDDYDYTPKDGAELWEHGQIPDYAFIVKDSGVEHVVTVLLPKRRAKAKHLVEKKPKPERPKPPERVYDRPPEFVPIPEGLSGEQEYDEIGRRVLELTEWLHRQPKRNPHRGDAGMELVRLATAKKAASQRRDAEMREKWRAESAARLEQENEESDEIVTNENGKVLLLPNIRYLLREVKELRCEVAELRQQVAERNTGGGPLG